MGALQEFDEKYRQKVFSLPKWLRPLMLLATAVGEPWVLLLITLTCFISAYRHGNQNVQNAFVYALVAFGLNSLLKLVLHRRRPEGTVVKTLGIRSYSFPSGHAFGSFIFYGLIAYLSVQYLDAPLSIIVAVLLAAVIFLIGLSRVYLDVHYPSDVIAGWITGSISLLIVMLLAF